MAGTIDNFGSQQSNVGFCSNNLHMDTVSQDQFYTSYRTFMTALFLGITNALLCLISNVLYRQQEPYFSSTLLNVSYIIFGSLFIFALIGVVYTLLLRYLSKGNIVYIVVFALLMFFLLFRLSTGHFDNESLDDRLTRELSRNITIISGICVVAGIPFLHHNRWFQDNVI